MSESVKSRVLLLLDKAGIVLTDKEISRLEMTDMGLGDLEVEGLQLITYINNEDYCAKELILLSNQTCPEHLHPAIGSQPGKRETFRCRWGTVYLYVEGEQKEIPVVSPPIGKEKFYTANREIVLKPGDQYTIEPGVKHWFQAGTDGAIVSEFSTTSRDAFDVFTDSNIKRVEGNE